MQAARHVKGQALPRVTEGIITPTGGNRRMAILHLAASALHPAAAVLHLAASALHLAASALHPASACITPAPRCVRTLPLLSPLAGT